MIDVTSKNKSKATLRLDLLKAFGADFQLGIREPLFFAGESGNAIIYPVGHHIAIRDIFAREDLRKNDIMFIYNDTDVLKTTAMNISRDFSLLLTCEKKQTTSSISIYNLSKLNFKSITIFKPKRKVISTIYSEFLYASFSIDGNYIATIGAIREDVPATQSDQPVLHGVIWDVQIFQSYKADNYKPKCVIPLDSGVNKITIEGKLICTSGKGHLCFWYIYENSVKEFKTGVKNLDVSKNYVDHEWVCQAKIPTIATITEEGDLYILEGHNDNNTKSIIKKSQPDDEYDEYSNNTIRVDRFIIKHHIHNCFNNDSIVPSIIKSFTKGLVIGSTKGHLLFVEKRSQTEQSYVPIRYTKREKPAKVAGLSFCKGEEYLAVSYDSNEIASIHIKTIFENFKSVNFDLQLNLVCDGFHQGAITSMDVALQRPIIVTTSNVDKTVRVWNFLTGHCEYCKIILTEKEKNQEKEMDILAVAIHPNGYYIAISDKEMIRFFHLCYKELRFYNTDSNVNESPKSDCHLLKFSYGGHLLAAVSGRQLFIIRSYTRETLKAFDTPHTGEITNIFFHEQDYFIYTIGTDGLIVEYNLFNFHVEKLSSKYVHYAGGAFSILSKYQTCVAGCGQPKSSMNYITEVICTEIESQETNEIGRSNEVYMTEVDKHLTALCNIKSKRFDTRAYAGGSEDGYMGLYPQLLCQGLTKEVMHPWKSIKSHRGPIRSIAYSRDTNLLFSAGDDGNLFIYCIHEYPDGETLSYEDNVANINQITSILDEGLGDNVLYPLSSIFIQEEEIQNQHNIIDEYKNQEEKLKAENINKLRELELDLNKKREIESKELNERLADMKLSKEGIIDHYKEQIKQIENDHRQTLIDKEKQYTERIDQMSNTIHDLNSKIYSLKAEHEVDLKKKDEGYEKKFREIDAELRTKFEEIKNNNDKLSNELQLRQKLEEYKFIHLDQEHEQEINYNNEKFETIITKMEKERLVNQGEIATLTDEKKKLISELNKCETELKKKNDEIKRHIDTIKALRQINEMKEIEKEDLKKKLKETEGELQEKSKLAGFSSKLKNELYIKNAEIVNDFNNYKAESNIIRDLYQKNKTELKDNTALLQDRDKEIKKNKLLLEEYKEKYERERHNAKLIEKDFDNLLQKIYDTFQSNDKNVIIKGIRKIYNMYLTNDVIQKIDSSKLNVNIRDELTKRIDMLQKGITNITMTNNTREKNQNSEIFKKTKENAALIKQLNAKKKAYSELEKGYLTIKSDYSALSKKFEQAKRLLQNAQGTSNNTNIINSNITKDSNMSNTMYNMQNKFHQQLKPLNVNDSEMMSSTLYKVREPGSGYVVGERKSWKEGKLYKCNSLSTAKDIRGDAFKISEFKKLLEEKNEKIRRQEIQINLLRQSLYRESNKE